MRIPGRATLAGTVRFAARALSTLHTAAAEGSPSLSTAPEGGFRLALGLCLSSIGFGTYQGEASDQVDACYREALALAIRLGCNVLDTAPNYRGQRSEIVLGQVVSDLIASGQVTREELVVLVIQVIRLVRLLRQEVLPILNSTQETVSTVRGTATFVSDHLVQPVVKVASYSAGVRQALNALLRIRHRDGRKTNEKEA